MHIGPSAPVAAASAIRGSARHTRIEKTLGEVKSSLEELASEASPESTVAYNTGTGSFAAGRKGNVLPLRLGALNRALDEISRRQSWLLERDPVTIYSDLSGFAHIDVVNFGGFKVGEDGRILAQSINPW
ncbi:MAG: hypothetical protein HY319_28680 [Armatimonadetes bacterium]|nr:hypothetical protein [Armatimonadota bacterium]